MSGYLAFMGKEFKEQIRTFKALILLDVYKRQDFPL